MAEIIPLTNDPALPKDHLLRNFYIFLGCLILAIILLAISGHFFYASMIAVIIGVIVVSITLLYFADYYKKSGRQMDENYVTYIVLNHLVNHPKYTNETTDIDNYTKTKAHVLYSILLEYNTKGKLQKIIEILEKRLKESDVLTQQVVEFRYAEVVTPFCIDVLKFIYSDLYRTNL